MTDVYDRAQALEQRQREQALAAQAAASRPQGSSLEHCMRCGQAIPEKRRQAAMGCTRCIRCQTACEKGHK
ncbi:TraR/DksA C4-type zinc finger protein [Vogesella mureinivorans]|uniref:TraR/DksA C4-type zinc finger protein n=1 Tax=Vogesella mureinivorans TaxID=657276 RepID=UPI0011CC7454|nr:TraR/DksA C4-type zinc finger protein [Vogesella mureinivorans]